MQKMQEIEQLERKLAEKRAKLEKLPGEIVGGAATSLIGSMAAWKVVANKFTGGNMLKLFIGGGVKGLKGGLIGYGSILLAGLAARPLGVWIGNKIQGGDRTFKDAVALKDYNMPKLKEEIKNLEAELELKKQAFFEE